ncbi:MAG: ATP-binding protein [Myxococcota bacterium]
MPSPLPARRSWFGRLYVQLVLGFLVVGLLPTAIVATTLTWRSADLAEDFVEEHVQNTARSYAAGVDLFVERHRGRLRDISMERADQARLTAAVDADPSLEALWAPGTGLSSAQAPAPWARAACADQSAGRVGLMKHAGEGHAHEVVIAVRHRDLTLCGQITFTLHQEMMSSQAGSSLGGSAYIVDREGVVVCHAFEEEQPHVPRGDVLSPTVGGVAQAGLPWAGVVTDSEEPKFAAFALASELPWGVWVEVPRAPAVAPFQEGLLQGMILAILVAFVAAGAAFWLARRLASPIQAVASAAGRVAAGELGASVPTTGPTEVAALASEFNRMSQALVSSHAELEQRVADRTSELAQARTFSDRLLDTLSQRILVIDPELNVVRANQAADDAYGQTVLGCACRAVHGTPEGAECPAAKVLRSGAAVRSERTAERDGRTEILAAESVPLLDEEGAIVGVLEVLQDVTEVQRIRVQLAQQDKMAALGTLAAGLAHEIGNPLASMSSELEMLEQMWDPSDARAALPVLRNQVRRMSGLLRELVDFGRPASDEATVFLPEDLLNDVARLLRHDPRSRSESVAVEVRCAVDVAISTRRDRLMQVLLNLGLNALDALDGAGRVVLAADLDELGDLRFVVEDDGPGIADEVATQVFDPFFTTKGPDRGTGLGLFVSERIAQSLGGALHLTSTTGGARFALTLPLTNQTEVRT